MQVLQRQAEHLLTTNQERPQQQRNQGQDPDSFCGAIGAGSEPLPAPAGKAGAVESDDQGKKTMLSVFLVLFVSLFGRCRRRWLLLVVAAATATVFSVTVKLGIVLDASAAFTRAPFAFLYVSFSHRRKTFVGYAGKGWLAHILA